MSAQITRTDFSNRLINITNVFPPLESITSIALYIAEIVKDFWTSKQEWQSFGNYVQKVVADVSVLLAQANAPLTGAKLKLENLGSVLKRIVKRITDEQSLPLFKRALRVRDRRDLIETMRKEVDDAVGLFQSRSNQLYAIATTSVTVDETLNAVLSSREILSQIAHRPALIAANLRRIPGAAWDLDRVCLPGTRTMWIKQITEWIENPAESKYPRTNSSSTTSNGAQVLLLTGVAGSGKSSIAHSVAQHCHERGCLGSSFFFRREIEGRNNPKALWSTIVADLACIDPWFAERAGALVENNWGLLSVPLSRQFKELLVESCKSLSITTPIVLVIDGLDEAWGKETLTIIESLRTKASQLPDNIRVILTCRMRQELSSFCRSSHVHWLELDIGTQENLDDIALFVSHKLCLLADCRNLGEGWPGETLREKFMARAEGLPLWVTIVCDYLGSRQDPTRELEILVSRSQASASTAEVQMDQLYDFILGSFNPNDEGFVYSYYLTMGTVLATKTPLSVSVMEDILGRWPLASEFTLCELSSLLTGMREVDHQKVAVRLLHQSLRGFLNMRTTCKTFLITHKESSQYMALLCLRILNNELSAEMAHSGYLRESLTPEEACAVASDEKIISRTLWYACQFWSVHLLDVFSPALVEEELKKFLKSKIALWIRLVTRLGRCQGLKEIRLWIKLHLYSEEVPVWFENYAQTCTVIKQQLFEDGRLEEASLIGKELVAIRKDVLRRQQASKSEKKSNSDSRDNSISGADPFSKSSSSSSPQRHSLENSPAVDDRPNDSGHLNSLGTTWTHQFDQLNELVDLAHAIDFRTQAAELVPDSHPNKQAFLTELGSFWAQQFGRLGDRADLDCAIDISTKALILTRDDHPSKPSYLKSLGSLLTCRWEQTRDLDDLNRMIELQEQAVELALESHLDKSSDLNCLGSLLNNRFELIRSLSDLNRMIELQVQVIGLTPDGHRDKPSHLKRLGDLLIRRFKQTEPNDGYLERLQCAVALSQCSKPINGPIFRRFVEPSELNVLDRALELQMQAADIAPDNHPNKPSYLTRLASSLIQRYEPLDEPAYLGRALGLQRQAIEFTSDEHPDKSNRLACLARLLALQFERTGNSGDLDCAAEIQAQVVDLVPDSHPDKPRHMKVLASLLTWRFRQRGELNDLGRALELQAQAVDLTPDSHSDKPWYLKDLGGLLTRRFGQTGELAQLDRAIELQTQAVGLTPDDHPDKQSFVKSLGSLLAHRFERLGELDDLDSALKVHELVVKLNPSSRPEPSYPTDSGSLVIHEFKHTGELADLDHTLELQAQANNLVRDGHPDKLSYLTCLGSLMTRRFEQCGQLSDLDRALELHIQAINLIPNSHPDKLGHLKSLEDLWIRRSEQDHELTGHGRALIRVVISLLGSYPN
ncbi:TPR-like protein [Ceratobasidium sp. AG-Ba]|nr:TPR-like protein [Ceratobasidium sp. AG-Ba]